MSNVIDYIRWRGDISFDERGVNEIDNIVFSLLSYFDFSKVIDENECVTLSELVKRLEQSEINIMAFCVGKDETGFCKLLREAAKSKRFSEVVISDYVDKLDVEHNFQFCALTFSISTNEHIIAYRGTDDSLIGWKEDMMFAFTLTASQRYAVEYAKSAMDKYSGQFYLCGHSKGGNLAFYTGANLAETQFSRIAHIYINDGPGFCKSILSVEQIEKVDAICTHIRPEYCIVGKFLEVNPSDVHIVRSVGARALQHDMLTWQVDGGVLDMAYGYNSESEWLSETMNSWIANTPNEVRAEFVNKFFDILISSGAKCFQDIISQGENGFLTMLNAMRCASGEIRDVVFKLPITVGGIANESADKNNKFDNIYSIAAIILGFLFLLLPENSMSMLFAAGAFVGVLTVFIRTVMRLKKLNWNLNRSRFSVFISIALSVVYIMVIYKEHALSLFSNIFFGIFFFYIAYHALSRIKGRSYRGKRKWKRIRYVFEIVLGVALGCFILLAPEFTIERYIIIIGAVFIIDGALRLFEHSVID